MRLRNHRQMLSLATNGYVRNRLGAKLASRDLFSGSNIEDATDCSLRQRQQHREQLSAGTDRHWSWRGGVGEQNFTIFERTKSQRATRSHRDQRKALRTEGYRFGRLDGSQATRR